MSCPDDNMIAAFLDGGLADSERSDLELHIDTCATCRGLLGEVALRATRVEGGAQEPRRAGTLRPGEMVDHFCVVGELGEGGMGRVYLTRDTQLGRRVALKLIQPALASSDRVVKMFRREARAMARISHPNIITVHSVGEHQGIPYVALEFVPGDTLQARYKNRAAAPREALRIGIGLADGLAEAHRHGIVHRDLKPSNVLLGLDDRPRLTDFGLAAFVRDRSDPVSSEAATFVDTAGTSPSEGGTPSYMAPEQWRGEVATGATDVWALGVILWEMFTGERLFQGNNEVELAGQICGREPVPSLLTRAGVPVDASALIDACLERAIEARPSAADAAVRLRRSLERFDRESLTSADDSPASEEGPTLPLAKEAARAAFKPRRASKFWSVVVAATLVILVASLLVAVGFLAAEERAAYASSATAAAAERLAEELQRSAAPRVANSPSATASPPASASAKSSGTSRARGNRPTPRPSSIFDNRF